MILRGTEGSTAQIGRTDGFNEILEAQENWTVLDEQDGNFTQTKGLALMEQFLELYEYIDVVICQNDNMAFGAIEAIEAAGRTCGPAVSCLQRFGIRRILWYSRTVDI